MPKWSDPQLLNEENVYNVSEEAGVYECGIMKNNEFQPRYIGRSDNSIRDRLLAHLQRKGNDAIAGRVKRGLRVYFRRRYTTNGACIETNLLEKYGYGRGKKYAWNERAEYKQC